MNKLSTLHITSQVQTECAAQNETCHHSCKDFWWSQKKGVKKKEIIKK